MTSSYIEPGRQTLSDQFIDASDREDVAQMRRLLDAGAEIGVIGETALMRAVLRSSLRSAKFLCEAGADPRANNHGPFVFAVHLGDLELVRMMIDRGADVDSNNGAPLSWALSAGRIDMTKLLLAKGAQFSEISAENLFTNILENPDLEGDCRQNGALAYLVEAGYLDADSVRDRLLFATSPAALCALSMVEAKTLSSAVPRDHPIQYIQSAERPI